MPLFLKAFAWFLIAAGLSAAVATSLTRPDLLARSDSTDAWRALAEEGAEVLSAEGEAALKAWSEDHYLHAVTLSYHAPDGRRLDSAEPVDPVVRRALPLSHTPVPLTVTDDSGRTVRVIPVSSIPAVQVTMVLMPDHLAHAPPPDHPLRMLFRPLRLLIGIVVVMGISLLFTLWLMRPIHLLTATARAIGQGQLDHRAPPSLLKRGDEIGTLAKAIDAMAEGLSAMVARQRRLVRDISHELRSPLARLRVAASMVGEQAPAKVTRLTERLDQEVAALDGLIERLLVLSRLDSGDTAGPKEVLNLGTLVTEAADRATLPAQARNLKLHVSTGDWPLRMAGHADLLGSVFDNLLGNAVKYADEDSTITVTCAEEGTMAVVCIANRGAGVPDTELQRIFEPFHRVSDARERDTGGHGIGLAIVKRAVEHHGGRVTAAPHPQGGLVVLVRLPLLDDQSDDKGKA